MTAEVKLGQHIFKLKCEQADAQAAADTIQQEMKRLRQQTGVVDNERLALMTALHMTINLTQQQRILNQHVEAILQRTDSSAGSSQT